MTVLLARDCGSGFWLRLHAEPDLAPLAIEKHWHWPLSDSNKSQQYCTDFIRICIDNWNEECLITQWIYYQ